MTEAEFQEECMVRPSINGKISFDAFFSVVFKDAGYYAEPYCGDIRAYLKDWMDDMGDEVENFRLLQNGRMPEIPIKCKK